MPSGSVPLLVFDGASSPAGSGPGGREALVQREADGLDGDVGAALALEERAQDARGHVAAAADGDHQLRLEVGQQARGKLLAEAVDLSFVSSAPRGRPPASVRRRGKGEGRGCDLEMGSPTRYRGLRARKPCGSSMHVRKKEDVREKAGTYIVVSHVDLLDFGHGGDGIRRSVDGGVNRGS